MSPLEQQVWAASYAAEFAKTRKFYETYGNGRFSIEDISGFSCAEVADVALEKFREAVNGPDKMYLIPVIEDDV
jgi:hypothetical protein